MKLVGAISEVPGRAQALGQRVAAATARGPQALVELLHATPRAALFSVRRPEEPRDGVLTAASGDGFDRFWIAGECIGGCDRLPPVADSVETTLARLHANLEGGFLGVRIDPAGQVTLLADSWGLSWTFVRTLTDAVVFGSDFAAICGAGDDSLTLDRDSLLLELCIGFSPDQRTIFAEIDVVPPGGVMQIHPPQTTLLRQERFAYGDEWAGGPTSAKAAQLDGHFERMGGRVARLAGGHAAISLSAGYDSRYALAVLSRAGAVGKLLTFGEPDSDEVVDARTVAACHAEPPAWDLFRIPQTSWTAWMAMIQSLGNGGIVQWCGWADDWLSFVRQRADACVIGYLGDSLSGKRLDLLRGEDGLAREIDATLGLWVRRWIAFELDMGEWAQSPLLRPHARLQLIRATAERFGALAAEATYAVDFQQALHCNLVGRQRRWVATQPELMCSHVKPLTFFADKAYRHFWMNVGLDDLLGQSLYLRYAEERFPRFFPKRPGAARRLARRVSGKLQRELHAMLGRNPAPRRPPPIIREKLLEPHFQRIRDALQAAAPWLDDIIDVAAMRQAVDMHARGAADQRLTTGMLFRCVNVMHLLALAERPCIAIP